MHIPPAPNDDPPRFSDPPAGFLDMYKLAVEMADRVSARRGLANTFFLTLNSGLLALLGGAELRWYVAIGGIVLAATWWGLLRSYRQLNAAKFEVILTMEERLPASIYRDEWRSLTGPEPFDNASPTAPYRELGRLEQIAPAVFATLFALEICRQALG